MLYYLVVGRHIFPKALDDTRHVNDVHLVFDAAAEAVHVLSQVFWSVHHPGDITTLQPKCNI